MKLRKPRPAIETELFFPLRLSSLRGFKISAFQPSHESLKFAATKKLCVQHKEKQKSSWSQVEVVVAMDFDPENWDEDGWRGEAS